MSTTPSNWKRLIRPHKAYLQALYRPSENLSNQQRASYWSLKAKKTDFHWVDGKPIPRRRLDESLKSAIQRTLVPMTINQALARREANDAMRVNLHIIRRFYRNGILVESPINVNVNVSTETDIQRLKDLTYIDRKYANKLMNLRDEWERAGFPAKHKFHKLNALMDVLRHWLTDKGIRIRPADVTDYEFQWWIDFTKSKASLRPFGASRAGPAYNHPVSNCALMVIKDAMSPLTDKQESVFEQLQNKYKYGVSDTDYAEIATKLGRKLKITFAPSADAAQRWIEQGLYTPERLYAEYGRKSDKTVYIHHWSNHATAMPHKPKHTYRYVSKDELVREVEQRYEQIYQTGEFSITFRNKLDGEFETIQLREVHGIQLDLGRTSPQSQLYDHYKSQLVPYSYDDPNREQYDQFCKHGLHFSTGQETYDDIDLDLAGAYSSYDKFQYYRGLPRDITYWVNKPSIEQVKSNSGFALVRFFEPIGQAELTAWLACCAVEFLHDNNLLYEIIQGAFAHITFELDTSLYIDKSDNPKIHKRVFHKLLGLSTQTKVTKRFISSDTVEYFDLNVSQFQLPSWIQSNTLNDSLYNHVNINVSFNLEAERYSHVAATIQDNITCEVWRKWLEIKQSNPNAKVVTCLVDGIRLSSEGFDLSTFNYDNGMWSRKTLKGCYTDEQYDWDKRSFTPAKIASNEFMRLDYPITIKEHYIDMLSVAKEGCLSFNDLANEGYIHCIQGYAGAGKSYTVRKLLEQFNACILTPTHSTREDMEHYKIREYLNDEELNKIPCFTYQSVIQRSGFVRDYQVIIIDEAGMLLAEHLNRIVEIAQRKLILFVGDPAQHNPITGERLLLEAKSLVFKNHIEANPDLLEAYNGSDWERNNMLTRLQYSCDFEPPQRLETETEEDHFDRSQKLKSLYAHKMRTVTSAFATTLRQRFRYYTARDIPAFETFKSSCLLKEVKRADDTEDGKALIDLCNNVREHGIEYIMAFCKHNPEYYYNNQPELTLTDRVISYSNKSVNEYNNEAYKLLYEQSNKDASDKLYDRLVEEAKSEDALTKQEATSKLPYALVDVDVPIIATDTFIRKIDGESITIYNGTIGTIRNFMVRFKDYEMPLTEVVTPVRKTKENPFKRPYLRVTPIRQSYGITSHRAQGRTFGEGLIFIDCNLFSQEMLYVAVSRARSIKQLRFIYKLDEDEKKPVEPWNIGSGYCRVDKEGFMALQTENINLGFKTVSSKTIYVHEDCSHYITKDISDFDWSAFVQQIIRDFENVEPNEELEKLIDSLMPKGSPEDRLEFKSSLALNEVLPHLFVSPPKKEEQELPKQETKPIDPYFFSNLAKQTFHVNGPRYTADKEKLPKKVHIGLDDVESYQHCCRVEYNGKRAFYWFFSPDHMSQFNEIATKIDGAECHELIVDNQRCAFFIDLDYKIRNDHLQINFDNIDNANAVVSDALVEFTTNAAYNLGWDTTDIKVAISQRSRQLDDRMSKISLHIYTNLSTTFSECSLIVAELKKVALDAMEYEYEDALWIEDMVEGIDCEQYHKNGSIAMPYGSKNGVCSTLIKSEIIPTIVDINGIRKSEYTFDYDNEDEEEEQEQRTVIRSKGLEKVFDVIHKCKYYNSQFTNSFSWVSADGKTALVRRVKAGHCSCCDGHHDNDNTLRVFKTQHGYGAVCSRGGSPTYFA